MCKHLLVPIFVPRRTAVNDSYRPAVLCLRCLDEFDPGQHLEPALAGLVARGMGHGLADRVRQQFRWHAQGSKDMSLSFDELRRANVARLPQFRDRKGRICHLPDGSDWALSAWSNAVCGELGEAANLIKKIERGDLSLEEARADLGRELADVQTYLDLLAFRAGIDLGRATAAKFNEVSARVGCDIRLPEAVR